MTPEQAGLIRKAQDSLKAAELLTAQGHHHFAASRAYYTMFYVAEALLLGENLVYSKHSAVISAFGQRFAKTSRVPQEFHRYLIDAEDSRNIADYDIHPGLTKEQVAEHISHAEQFLQLAKQLIGPVPLLPDESE